MAQIGGCAAWPGPAAWASLSQPDAWRQSGGRLWPGAQSVPATSSPPAARACRRGRQPSASPARRPEARAIASIGRDASSAPGRVGAGDECSCPRFQTRSTHPSGRIRRAGWVLRRRRGPQAGHRRPQRRGRGPLLVSAVGGHEARVVESLGLGDLGRELAVVTRQARSRRRPCVRPRCSGRELAVTAPSRTARMKFVLDSIVAVPTAPSGRFRYAHVPPPLSASAISTPPCIRPPIVQQLRRPGEPRGPPAPARPRASRCASVAANGTSSRRVCRSGSGMALADQRIDVRRMS